MQVFVLGHTDEMLSTVPRAAHLVPVDLRALTLPDQFNTDQFGEGRFLLSDEARTIDADYVGLCSANLSIRFPTRATLNDLRRLRPLLRPDRVFAAHPERDWRAATEGTHPGMTLVLDEIETAMGGNAAV